jgi:polyisoprenyl-teichoic acid--peptidoglycan teichoic acid transferase
MSTHAATIAVATPRRRAISFKRVVKRTFSLLLIAALVTGGWLGWKFYQDTSKLTGDKNPLSWLNGFTPSPLQETNGRVNILVAGYSADDAGHAGGQLTDSIMILSVNPTDKSAVIISVPRDLYVNIPGYGYSKINAAYEYGKNSNFSGDGYASGGMGLLEKTLTEDFGVTFNYSTLINYTAFKDAVNAVGGVKVDIQSPNARGLYDPNANLKLPNGTANLNGQQALDLARARGEGYGSYGFTRGDFDRTAHQQMLLLALKDKASSAGVISNPLKIGSLADALGNNVKTDMTVGEIETLYSKVKDIQDSNIKSVTLNNVNGKDLLASYQTYNGQSALIPADGVDDYTTIQNDINALLYPQTANNQ